MNPFGQVHVWIGRPSVVLVKILDSDCRRAHIHMFTESPVTDNNNLTAAEFLVSVCCTSDSRYALGHLRIMGRIMFAEELQISGKILQKVQQAITLISSVLSRGPVS